MPRYRASKRRRQTPPHLRELADVIALAATLTTAPTPLDELAARLGWRGRRLLAALGALRERGVRIVTADQLTARLADHDASDRALEFLEKAAPGRC